jgi:voltage-gated potassium channel
MTEHAPVTPYDLFSLALSIVALGVLGLLARGGLSAESRQLLEVADATLCAFFFADFCRNLIRADNRLRYLRTWGWLDLAASIPAIEALRLGRLGRVVRVLRVLRAVKASRMLVGAFRSRRRESTAWAAMLIALLVLFGGSVAILEVESGRGGNITNAADAVWWSVVTITTVGYGDFYPVTIEGRLIAVGLMVVGVGLFGTLSGMAASWFTEAVAAERAQAGDHLR